eukprot:5035428-Pyramimonas_sp.AAC.1
MRPPGAPTPTWHRQHILSSLQAWQRWSTAEAEAPGSGGPLATAISEALRFQDRVSDAIASVDQALA